MAAYLLSFTAPKRSFTRVQQFKVEDRKTQDWLIEDSGQSELIRSLGLTSGTSESQNSGFRRPRRQPEALLSVGTQHDVRSAEAVSHFLKINNVLTRYCSFAVNR